MDYPLKPLRVYVDTSVLGGCFDIEFCEYSTALIDAARSGRVLLVVSDTTLAELSRAPADVRNVLADLPETSIEYIPQGEASEALAGAYIEEAVVPVRMLADALHIAVATLARVDVLVSWNFKHIVNLNRIHAFNAVNLRAGYPQLEIRSPREVLEYGNEVP